MWEVSLFFIHGRSQYMAGCDVTSIWCWTDSHWWKVSQSVEWLVNVGCTDKIRIELFPSSFFGVSALLEWVMQGLRCYFPSRLFSSSCKHPFNVYHICYEHCKLLTPVWCIDVLVNWRIGVLMSWSIRVLMYCYRGCQWNLILVAALTCWWEISRSIFTLVWAKCISITNCRCIEKFLYWNIGVLIYWKLVSQSIGVLKYWGYWRIGVLTYGCLDVLVYARTDVLTYWCIDVLVYCRVAVLVYWHIGVFMY